MEDATHWLPNRLSMIVGPNGSENALVAAWLASTVLRGGTFPDGAQIKPDDNRAKEFLEQYTFDSLRMVGGLARAGVDWVLVRDPDGGIHRVTLGNFLGRNHGKIVEMAETYVAVIEIVSDGTENGWVERPRTIKLDGV